MEIVIIIANVNTKEKLKETFADYHKPFYSYFDDSRSVLFVAFQFNFKLAMSFAKLKEKAPLWWKQGLRLIRSELIDETLIVPIENEESRPKNNPKSYNSNFIRSEINSITTDRDSTQSWFKIKQFNHNFRFTYFYSEFS